MSHETVHIDTDNTVSVFILSGNLNGILNNTRFVFSLKRLSFTRDGDKILIPFDKETKIKTLTEIQLLLEEFSLASKLSETSQSEFSSYDREQKAFREFSEKARQIRNDCFKDNPELVADFDVFKNVVKAKLVRELYPLQLLSAFHMAFSQNACNFAVPGAG